MKLALAGDAKLGRGVGERLAGPGHHELPSDGVVAAAHEADLAVVNLECVVSERGASWPDPDRPVFSRAPPAGVGPGAGPGVGEPRLRAPVTRTTTSLVTTDTSAPRNGEASQAAALTWSVGAGRRLPPPAGRCRPCGA